MNPSAIFIARPVTTVLLMLGVLVFGTMAYQQLPVSDLPAVDFPSIQVSAALPGASPDTIASAVTLQFDLSRNIDAAAQDVQSMIARTQRSLPPQMPAPPSFQKVNPADQPVMMLVLRSSTMPIAQLDE